MVNMGATVEAHQWSAQSQSWQKIGEVVGSNKTKATFEGKEYDYVFDIDVGAGPNGNLKLPYNVSRKLCCLAIVLHPLTHLPPPPAHPHGAAPHVLLD